VRHFRGSGRGGGAGRRVEWTGRRRGFCRLRRVLRTPGDGGARANGGIALSALPVFRRFFFFYEVILSKWPLCPVLVRMTVQVHL
jgi:hypothetical protein